MTKHKKNRGLFLFFILPVTANAHGEEVFFFLAGFGLWFASSIVLFSVYHVKYKYRFLSIIVSMALWVTAGYIPGDILKNSWFSFLLQGFLIPMSATVFTILAHNKDKPQG